MKAIVKLEKAEKDALETISTASCLGVPCSSCPLDYQDDDYEICFRAVCQRLLEDDLNKY